MTQRPAPSRSRARVSAPSGARRRAVVGAAAAAALVLAGVVAVSTSGAGAGGAGAAELEVSYDRTAQALAFSGPTFDGGTFDLAATGKPAVVNFYASWCTICDRELPDFEKVSDALAGKVQFVGVNPQSNDTDGAQARMIERGGVTYPTVRDPDDALLREFNTTGGLPTTLFVDADGVVRKVHNGLLTEQALRQTVADVLGVRA